MASENPAGAEQKKTQGQQAAGGEQRAARAGETPKQQGMERGEERRAGGGLSRREARAPMIRGSDIFTMSPFSLMRRMMDDFDRMFEDVGFGMGGLMPRGELPGEALSRGALWTPQIDVLEREGQLVVRADLPGLSKDDLRIEVRDDALVIEGERRREQKEEGEGFYRSERSYGSFRRAIPLPEGVDPEKAEARFENGVLEVSLPLPKERAQGKRIEIRGGTEGKSVH